MYGSRIVLPLWAGTPKSPRAVAPERCGTSRVPGDPGTGQQASSLWLFDAGLVAPSRLTGFYALFRLSHRRPHRCIVAMDGSGFVPCPAVMILPISDQAE
jgi:hypothetical protein